MNKLLIKQVTVMGDEGKCILDIDHLSLNSGCFLALKGISGAGKSTFLNVISGILPPSHGQVSWDGTDITTLSEAQKATFRRRNMGLIFQDFPLFEELSLLENIAVAAKYRHRQAATIKANAQRLMQHFAFDDLKRTAKNYSGGQKQRIAFMRALATNPQILIADEPTAALDRENAKKMADFLCAEKGDKTLIITSHDDYLLTRADRVLTINAGKITETT